ncbi:MAG: cell division topological specificity factor MinE [Thermodesulfobacteriota bacterium]
MLNGFFDRFIGKHKSKDIAKKRLQFALIYDKLDISEDILSNLQKDIIEVVSRYFIIDTKSLTLDIQREQNLSALVVNTPIIRAVRRDGKAGAKGKDLK